MNRETAAAVTATNTGLLITLAAILFALIQGSGPDGLPAPPWEIAGGPDTVSVPPAVERGWEVYSRERCSSCHSVAGRGSPRYPLDGVGDRLDPATLRRWITAPREMRPRVRKAPYDHLSDDELDALVAFLQTLTEAR